MRSCGRATRERHKRPSAICDFWTRPASCFGVAGKKGDPPGGGLPIIKGMEPLNDVAVTEEIVRLQVLLRREAADRHRAELLAKVQAAALQLTPQ